MYELETLDELLEPLAVPYHGDQFALVNAKHRRETNKANIESDTNRE